MNTAFKKFILYSVVAGAVLMFGAWPVYLFFGSRLDIFPVFFVVPFVMAVTILFHYYLMQALSGNPKSFVNKFMALSGIKLMLYLTVIVFYVVWYQQNISVFLTTFLISYFVFTFIEVIFILSQLKK
jgi:hypothetical protein